MGSLNVGILGHVDSGKTTLTKKIAELASTCAFDKHADSGGRKNTLDLGFSSMIINNQRIALIDCPGHSALIKAVLAASTVFDIAIVIIDASNGIQPQTAEHLLLCSIFCRHRVIVVLNKIDLIDESTIEHVKKKIRKGLKAIGIDENSPIVPMSLNENYFKQDRIEELKNTLSTKIFQPERPTEKPFMMALDHCFSIKGKGTVLTGTVFQGILKIGQEIEFCSLKEVRKVKSIESWKESVEEVRAGERAAVLVSNFDDSKFSRTIVSEPGFLKPIHSCISSVVPISFFKSSLTSKSKIHISIGFETVMAECQFVRQFDDEFEQLNKMEIPCMVILTFERTVYVNEQTTTFLMASRLEQNGKGCRFAFRGEISKILSESDSVQRFTRKHRTGMIERIEKDGRSAICTGMFKPETNFDLFRNMNVQLSDGTFGKIEGAFGKSGKFRIVFEREIEQKLAIELHMKKYLNSNAIVSYLP